MVTQGITGPLDPLSQWERSGTTQLKDRLELKLQKLRKQQLTKSKSELKIDNERTYKENALQYYLDWVPSAIHLLWTIDEYKDSPSKVAKRLGIKEYDVINVLELLTSLDLMKKQRGNYRVTKNNLHIENMNLFSSLHHKNWRNKAMDNQSVESSDNFHYTSIYSLDKESHELIREQIKELIERVARTVKPAPEKTISCLNIDFFEI